MPLAKVTAQRTREAELRRSLREMRTAIDKFKDAADLGQIGSLDIKVGSENYPPDLETLVDGVTAANDATGRKLKFLRRIPIDPMTQRHRMGPALVSGQARLHALGRPERVRRLHDVRRHGARRHQIQRLVTGEWSAASRARLHAHRAHGRGRDSDRHPGAMGLTQYRNSVTARARSGPEGRSVPDARRDRSVLRRQEAVARARSTRW